MSNSLPGNPHAKDAEVPTESLREWMSAEGETDATMLAVALDSQTQATLAVAHEHRTANLLGVLNARWANGAAMFPREADDPAVRQEILRRLGLEADQ